MGVSLNLKTDDSLRAMLYQMGDDAPAVAEKIVRESGRILVEALREEVTNNTRLTEKQKRLFLNNIEEKYYRGRYTAIAQVGWLFKNYDDQPTPVGVKAIWAEYGTQPRRTAEGYNRGYMSPAWFVTRARKKVAKKIAQRQDEMLNEEWRKRENG